MDKKLLLKPRINKKNGQINFSLKKNSIPKKYKNKLPSLKGIKIKLEDFEW